MKKSAKKRIPSKKILHYPLTSHQLRLWFEYQKFPKSTTYNIFFQFNLEGDLNINALESALNILSDRHEALRTYFSIKKSKPIQIILPKVAVNLEYYDFGIDNNKNKKVTIQQLIEGLSNTIIDITSSPLAHYRLIKTGPNQFIFCLLWHHIIIDGLSIRLFFEQLSEVYNCIVSDCKLDWVEPAYLMTDLCRDSKKNYTQTILKKNLRYWDKRLEGAHFNVNHFEEYSEHNQNALDPMVLKGQRINIVLQKRLSQKIMGFIEKNHTTLFIFLTAALNCLLFRYTTEEDLVIGYSVNVRDARSHDYFGFLVNNLPFRTCIKSHMRFSDLLKEVGYNRRQDKKYQSTPLIEIINNFRKEHCFDGADLFNVAINQLTNISYRLNFYQVECVAIPIQQVSPRNDFSLLFDHADVIQLEVEYNTQKYSRWYIEQIIESFICILTDTVKNPDKRLCEINLMSEAKKLKLLKNENQPLRNSKKQLCVHQLFEQQVILTPDKIAIKSGKSVLTYRQLNERSDQLAQCLIRKSPRNIGLCVERSIEMVVGMLAILKAGASFVPLDPYYPESRLQFLLKDAQLSTVLTQSHLIKQLNILSENKCEVIFLDVDTNYKNTLKNLLHPTTHPSDLAYVMYTSGSTGQPKGVMVTHANLANHMLWMKRAYPLTVTDNVLQKTIFCFDASLWEFFLPLLCGATLVMLNPQGHQDPYCLIDYIERFKITVIQFVPTMLEMFLEIVSDRQWAYRLKSLRYVFSGGEALSLALKERCLTLLKVNLVNLYGPTETTIDATHWLACLETENKTINVPIGKPIDHTRCYVLDKQLALCPPGVVGELYISGLGVAAGYLNQPALTKKYFLENPFVKKDNKQEYAFRKLYRTGDRARWLANGILEYKGRNDFQVKIRGFRVELAEIENKLSQHPLILQCSVIVFGKGEHACLVAYYLSSFAEEIQYQDQFTEYLSQSLPQYMVPSMFIRLKTLPLTPSGKINRQLLPAPNVTSSLEILTAPSNLVENKLVSIWSVLLKRKTIDIHTSFFQMGGSSLLAMKLQMKIHTVFHMEITIVDIFQHPTVATLARFIQSKEQHQSVSSVVKNDSIKNVDMRLLSQEIAIIGMACIAPGARNQFEYWENLKNGVESISDFSNQDLLEAGIDKNVLAHPNYVKRSGVISETEQFDAAFFGFTPREAKIMDPQHRYFLECAFSALEDAALNIKETDLKIGIYAGQGFNHSHPLFSSSQHTARVSENYALTLHNEKDFLTTKVSYALNFTGPSLNIQTGCSTSLVAIDTAINQLLHKKCDIALAGGVTLLRKSGYLYEEGMILSPDGCCRAFDEKAQGTVPSSAVGVVVLKPLQDALKHKNNIYAVIKGSAVNNDGAAKMGFTAPGVKGQSAVIAQALENASVNPETIGYVEAHGTGTLLGDPIEITALTEAYRAYTLKKNYCAIGSVKTNIGHTDTAAGVMGLIKTVLSLQHQLIPPTLHFNKPNPHINFQESPFFVNTILKKWETTKEGVPRRAAVSSFGVGGTNAHIILEEAPKKANLDTMRPKSDSIKKRLASLPDHQSSAKHTEEFLSEQGIVIDAVQSILGFDTLNANDDFFELGGDSLSAIQLASLLKDRLKISITIRSIMEHSKLRDLAEFLGTQKRIAEESKNNKNHNPKISSQILPMHREKYGEDCLLSAYQESLLFLDQLTENKANYNIAFAWKIQGKFQEKILSQSIDALIARHSSLRTIFCFQEDGNSVQKILPPFSLTITVEKISEKILMDSIHRELLTPFDLRKSPLVRIRIFQISDNQTIFLFNHHHIISDGWSIQIMRRELAELYQAAHKNTEPSLVALPLQYVDFANWQHEEFKGALYRNKLAAWRKQLAGYQPLNISTKNERPEIFSYQGAVFQSRLSYNLANQLRKLATQQKTTLFTLLITAFYVLLSRYSGQKDIVIGSPFANRYHPDIENIVGFFANTLVLRQQIDPFVSFATLMETVSRHLLWAQEHQEIPFYKIVEELKIERDTRCNPIFQVMFILQNVEQTNFHLPAVSISDFDIPVPEISKFDLTLTIKSSEEGFIAEYEYCTDLFSKDYIQKMAEYFEILLFAIVENPMEWINRLPDAPLDNFSNLAREVNKSVVDNSSIKVIHESLPQPFIKKMESIGDTVKMSIPRNDIEFKVHNIWQKVLHKKNIQTDSHFFYIGGNSLLAMRVAHQLNQAFGVEIPVADILRYPVLEDFAAYIKNLAHKQERSPIFELQKGSSKQKIICIHPAGGTAFCYLQLGIALGETYGIYGIQALGIESNEQLITSVSEMAIKYRQLIKTAEIVGPYVLLGWSFGGIVAYEMACQMRAIGEQVKQVILLDTVAPNPANLNLVTKSSKDEFINKLIRFKGVYPGITEEHINRYYEIYNTNTLAFKEYIPQIYAGDVMLLKSKEDDDNNHVIDMEIESWKNFIKGCCHVAYVRGGHWSLMDFPQVEEVAASIKNLIQ